MSQNIIEARRMLCRRPSRTMKGRDYHDCLEDATSILNGNVSYGDGINSQHIDGVFATVADSGLAATQFTVNHTLNRVPVGFHIVSKTSAGDIFMSAPSTAKQMFFTSPTAHVLNIKFFIF